MSADAFTAWLAALEARHLADLRLPEVTRALRALSAAYVERRATLHEGGALNSAGKRAAFALFYGPLHLLTTRQIVRQIDGASRPAPKTILDLGCGTGAAGAGWALECDVRPNVVGLDRHPANLDEARWTYRQLGISGSARIGDVARARLPKGDVAILAAYVLNEMRPAARDAAWGILKNAVRSGSRLLVIEPIARAVTPWWAEMSKDVVDMGGRVDEWRFAIDLPPIVRLLDRSAGLDHREITARSLFVR